ncbi:MAG: hypothetical protein DWQ44_00110 [Bacteroidetes bacterium]|nr:MAG: hypothetical protein DWQ33_05060 [Bacteroidota bacterium]REK06033.1 MAG: hypothetical protein DWQ39_04200 [Bacteroidota bacterium]REK37091.1 MAG: hypothetical protein DWQ44_00110 [Bacteroidota bacterium]REK47516.1 MAG: hypothetical protein DWQ48_12335 [Bacteroidota bacterium]
MIDIKEFPDHLKSLDGQDWLKLFSLIPEIERTKAFGEWEEFEEKHPGVYVMPCFVNAEIVQRFCQTMYELRLVPSFDWPSWTEGKRILDAEETDKFSSLDSVTLCKLLTVIIRSDRFCEGTLNLFFSRGIVLAILKELHRKHGMLESQVQV